MHKLFWFCFYFITSNELIYDENHYKFGWKYENHHHVLEINENKVLIGKFDGNGNFTGNCTWDEKMKGCLHVEKLKEVNQIDTFFDIKFEKIGAFGFSNPTLYRQCTKNS